MLARRSNVDPAIFVVLDVCCKSCLHHFRCCSMCCNMMVETRPEAVEGVEMLVRPGCCRQVNGGDKSVVMVDNHDDCIVVVVGGVKAWAGKMFGTHRIVGVP